jgi:ribosomal-protein-alanine N-acetyltransferase
MLSISPARLDTERLVLRRLQSTDAETLWPVLSDPKLYDFIPRDPPASLSDVEARCARICVETAPDRDSQWLNWVVVHRTENAAIGVVEATVSAQHEVAIAYMFASRVWGAGYAREAVSAVLTQLRDAGAAAFTATLDTRNHASRRLVEALGFSLTSTQANAEFFKGAWSDEETWRLETAHAREQR